MLSEHNKAFVSVLPSRRKSIQSIMIEIIIHLFFCIRKLTEASLMETGTTDSPSLTRLLQDRGDSIPQLNSTELSGLSTFLDSDKADHLSDSLNRLSTSDLLPRTHLWSVNIFIIFIERLWLVDTVNVWTYFSYHHSYCHECFFKLFSEL